MNNNQIGSQTRPLKQLILPRVPRLTEVCDAPWNIENRLGYVNEVSFRKIIRSHKGEVTKLFKNQSTRNNGRADKKNLVRQSLYFTFYFNIVFGIATYTKCTYSNNIYGNYQTITLFSLW